MDFTLTSEQDMLRSSARRFLADDFANRRRQDVPTHSTAWRNYADLGWLALPMPEDAGGLGGSVEDVLILAEELGRALVIQPYAASCILAGRLIDRVASGPTRLTLLGNMLAGELRLSPALYEPGMRYSTLPETRAFATEGGYRLSGQKCLVFGGAEADAMLVSARMADDGIGLFQVPADRDGVNLTGYSLIDGSSASDTQFDDAELSADAFLGIVTPDVLEDSIDEARLALCADALGAMDMAVEMTADYLKTRTQFGQPLAGFQALQHSLVDQFIHVDSIRSAIFNAVSACHRDCRDDRARAISGCWIKTFSVAKDVAGMAVHLHGGIGMTAEYPVGHVLRRMIVSERSFGDVEFHLARYMASAASGP